MRIYVINLDRRPERMDSFNKNKFPFAVERFSAIESANGQDGCNESHFAIMRQHTELPLFILEDDCVMVEPWEEVERAMCQLPPDWDALWLGGTLDAPLSRYSENLFRLRQCYCTHAIIYNSQRMIDYILSNFDAFKPTITNKKIIDVFYYEKVQEKFNCYITYPMMAVQAEGYSDIMKRTPGLDEHQWRWDCYNKFTQ
jgi:hypothetical protein